MKKRSFVATLFIMSIASIGTGITDRSIAWFIGGIILFVVARKSLQLYKQEQEDGVTEYEGEARLSVIGWVLAAAAIILGLIIWIAMSQVQ